MKGNVLAVVLDRCHGWQRRDFVCGCDCDWCVGSRIRALVWGVYLGCDRDRDGVDVVVVVVVDNGDLGVHNDSVRDSFAAVVVAAAALGGGNAIVVIGNGSDAAGVRAVGYHCTGYSWWNSIQFKSNKGNKNCGAAVIGSFQFKSCFAEVNGIE